MQATYATDKQTSFDITTISGTIIENREHTLRYNGSNVNSRHNVNLNQDLDKNLGICNIKIRSTDIDKINCVRLTIAGMDFDRFYPKDMKELIQIDLTKRTVIPITDQSIDLSFECNDATIIDISYNIFQFDDTEQLKGTILSPFKQIYTFDQETVTIRNDVGHLSTSFCKNMRWPLVIYSIRLVTDTSINHTDVKHKNAKQLKITITINNETYDFVPVKENVYTFIASPYIKGNDITHISIHSNNDDDIKVCVFTEVGNVCMIKKDGCHLLFST